MSVNCADHELDRSAFQLRTVAGADDLDVWSRGPVHALLAKGVQARLVVGIKDVVRVRTPSFTVDMEPTWSVHDGRLF